MIRPIYKKNAEGLEDRQGKLRHLCFYLYKNQKILYSYVFINIFQGLSNRYFLSLFSPTDHHRILPIPSAGHLHGQTMTREKHLRKTVGKTVYLAGVLIDKVAGTPSSSVKLIKAGEEPQEQVGEMLGVLVGRTRKPVVPYHFPKKAR